MGHGCAIQIVISLFPLFRAQVCNDFKSKKLKTLQTYIQIFIIMNLSQGLCFGKSAFVTNGDALSVYLVQG